jgi:glycosyltransferase involved in cell wall biosynthesis
MSDAGIHVVITHHFLAHYRRTIYNALCRQQVPFPRYSFVAGTRTNIPIKTIDAQTAEIDPNIGGLRWTLVKNYWFFKIFLWQSGLVKLAVNPNVDVIIYLGVMYHLSTWVSILSAKLMGKRVLMWTHGYLREERGIKGRIRELFYRLSDGLLLYGNRAREILLKRGFDPDKLYVVYNSLDYDLQCVVRNGLSDEVLAGYKRMFAHPHFPTLMYIGRLTSDKRVDMLIQAAYLLRARGTSVNVLIIGEGPALESLKQTAGSRNMNEIIYFYGACYKEEEIGAMITLSDLCVVPGDIGLTCMHSLVYGTPVITHDNPDCSGPEWEAIKPGGNGDLFKHNDVEDLALVIENWLKRNRPRDEIRRACRAMVDKYYNPHYQIKIINEAVKGTPAGKLTQM